MQRWIKPVAVLFLIAALASLVWGGIHFGSARVAVEWETASEVDMAGFNLYRSENKDGPFTEKINSEVVPPAEDPLAGGKYSYPDAQVKSGTTYYYMLEAVSQNGSSQRFGPVEARAVSDAWVWLAMGVILGLTGLVLLLPARKKAEPLPAEVQTAEIHPVEESE